MHVVFEVIKIIPPMMAPYRAAQALSKATAQNKAHILARLSNV